MIAKLLLQNTFFVLAMAALLFAFAGTLHWPGAWAYLIASALIGPACGLWLAKVDPGLLAERMRLTAREGQPAEDKRFMLVFLVIAVLWFVAMGLDRRFGGADAGVPLIVLGLALYLLSTVLILWVFRTNSFAAPGRQGADRAPPSRDLDRPLRAGPPSDVCQRDAVLHRRAIDARLLVGPCLRSGVLRDVRVPHRDRGAHAEGGIIRLC